MSKSNLVYGVGLNRAVKKRHKKDYAKAFKKKRRADYKSFKNPIIKVIL